MPATGMCFCCYYCNFKMLTILHSQETFKFKTRNFWRDKFQLGCNFEILKTWKYFSHENTFQCSVTPKIVLHGYYDNKIFAMDFFDFSVQQYFLLCMKFSHLWHEKPSNFSSFFLCFWKIFAILLLPYEIPFRKMLLRNMNVEKICFVLLDEIVKNINSLPLKNKILLLQKLIHPAMNQMSK